MIRLAAICFSYCFPEVDDGGGVAVFGDGVVVDVIIGGGGGCLFGGGFGGGGGNHGGRRMVMMEITIGVKNVRDDGDAHNIDGNASDEDENDKKRQWR